MPDDEWYTPLSIIQSLGEFDLDPACGPMCPNKTAKNKFESNGLGFPWYGRVWLNPPFSDARPWIRRLMNHGNGIALVFSRVDAKWFQDAVREAGCFFMMHGRIGFLRPDGRISRCPLGCALIPFGDQNSQSVKSCGLDGVFLRVEK
jgi:hypothetical protein